MQYTPLIVLDIETTGLSPHRHHITEIAAVKLLGNKVIDRFEQLINPQVHIPRFITKLTGITDDMVKNKPTIDKVLPSFEHFANSDILVAHNASFDYNFLAQKFYLHRKKAFTNNTLCTKRLANRIIPELPSKRLGALCEHFGVINKQAHRAMGDVMATTSVFQNMLDILAKKQIIKQQDVIAFEQMPRQKATRLLLQR